MDEHKMLNPSDGDECLCLLQSDFEVGNLRNQKKSFYLMEAKIMKTKPSSLQNELNRFNRCRLVQVLIIEATCGTSSFIGRNLLFVEQM